MLYKKLQQLGMDVCACVGQVGIEIRWAEMGKIDSGNHNQIGQALPTT